MNYKNGIYGFFGENRFLSNYELLNNPVKLFGFDFYHTEGAYQAAKSEDPNVHDIIVKLTPNEAKRKGGKTSKIMIVRHNWDNMRDFFMYEINRQKYENNPELLKKLLATEDKYLEETNYWNDNYWGCHISEDHEEVINNTCTSPNRQGLNKLGFCLMSLRTYFQGNA